MVRGAWVASLYISIHSLLYVSMLRLTIVCFYEQERDRQATYEKLFGRMRRSQ